MTAVAKKVLTDFPDWKWMLCGEGPEREMLLDFCKREGLEERLVLLGYVPKVEEWLARAKVFVLTSRAEGLPMCLLEARSCGLPCVSFDVPTGPADLISEGINGCLIKPFDCEDMAAKLEQLMGDPVLLEKMSRNASEGLEPFGLSEVVGKWKELILRLLE